MRVLLVALDAQTTEAIERGARLAGEVEIAAVTATDAVVAASGGEPPAAAVVADAGAEAIRLAQSLAAIDRDMAITVLCAPERQQEVQASLRFAPLITANTRCRSTDDVEQLGVDLVGEGQAAVRRREHRLSVAAATERLGDEPQIPRLRGEALGRLVDAAPIGIVALDAGNAVAAWNSYAAEVIGVPEQEALGRPVHALFDAAERDRLRTLLEQARRPEPRREPLLVRRSRQGAEQFLEVVAGPTVSQTGERSTLIVLSDVTQRVLADRARRRAEDAQAFLAETGALLDASLDTVETLQRMASLAVPGHAELCVIDLLHDDGTIEGVAFAARDAEVAEAVEDIRRRYPLDPRGAHPVARVLRTGRAERLEELTEEIYEGIAEGPEHVALMRRLHYHSALVAPLTARGRTYGVISLLHVDPDRAYSPEDLAVLEDVARRAALALDNARLYGRERTIAATLQRSLLPARLPNVAGLALASHYEAGDGDVGGDWYDVIPLPDGRVGCVVGDVVGRGIKAASVMGQLRNAVRVYALERQSADDVVNAVDYLCGSLGIDEMATLVYVIVDAARETVEICSAGHPPPLVVLPGTAGRYIMGGRSGPVGVGLAGAHLAATEPFPPGALLMLYTDGLIERRDAPLDDGMARLETATTVALAAGADPAEVAERVVAALRPGPNADDVALLVLLSETVANRLRLSFPADPGHVATVRSSVWRWLDGRLPEEDVYDIVLACSEACANAIEHAYAIRRGEVEIDGELTDEEVTITVRDHGRWRPAGASGRGRGTAIMQAAMEEVEVTTGGSGTEVVMRRSLRPVAAA